MKKRVTKKARRKINLTHNNQIEATGLNLGGFFKGWFPCASFHRYSNLTTDINMEEVEKKFSKFINLLKERTINSIDNSDIKESCTATLLLLFAAIDSLSKITCGLDEYELYKKKTGNKIRFKGFLETIMGGNYAVFKDNMQATLEAIKTKSNISPKIKKGDRLL